MKDICDIFLLMERWREKVNINRQFPSNRSKDGENNETDDFVKLAKKSHDEKLKQNMLTMSQRLLYNFQSEI